MWKRLTTLLADKSRWIAVVCLCSTVVPLYWLRDAHIDNSIEVWIGTRGEAHCNYQRFLEKYGNEEFIVIAGEAQDPLSDEALAFQDELASRLRKIERVDGVLDIAQAAAAFKKFRPDDWRESLCSNGLFCNLLLGRDGHTFGVVAWLRKFDDPMARKVVVEQIESVVAEVAGDKMQLHLAGTPLLNVALDRGSRDASLRIMPASLLVSLVILAIVLRRISGVIAVMGAVGVTTIWTVGLIILAGRTFNAMTTTLPSLLTILSLSSGIHIVLRVQSLLADMGDRRIAIREALREMLPAIFLSNVTSAIGFGSLMVSDMQPISDFGLFVAIGLMLSFFFTAAIVPGILSWLRTGAVAVPHRPTHWTAPLGRFAASHRVWFLASSVVVLVVSLLLMRGLRVESNLVKFFPPDSKVGRDYEFIGERLTGLHTLEFDAVTDAQNGSALLKQIEQLGADLAARPEVAQVIHYKSLAASLDPIRQSVFVETARASQNPLKLLARKYRHAEDGQVSLRMSILVRAMASSEFYTLLDFAQRQAAQRIEPPATYTLTGVVPLLNAALESLITTQVRSFAAAAVTVLVLVGLFFRSWKVFLAASLPNLLPTAILFATMAAFNLPLDSATVMIAGVGIGIAVDDTFHFFSCYRAARLAGQDNPTAIHSSFCTTGRGILFTSIVATAGFGILLLAEFKPIQYFGLLAGVTMLTASAADFLVLPACVAFVNLWPRSPRRANGICPGPENVV